MKKLVNLIMNIFISDKEEIKMKWKTTIIGSVIFAVITYNYIAVPVLASQGVIISPIPIEQISDIITTII